MLQMSWLQGAVPTFKTFVTMLIDNWTNKVISSNRHIMTYWKSCDFCHVNYNVTGFEETWNDDVRYISQKVWHGLGELE